MEETLRKYCQHYIPEDMCPYIKSGFFAILVVSGTAFLFSLVYRLHMRAKVKRAMKDARNKRAEQLKSLKEKLEKSSVSISNIYFVFLSYITSLFLFLSHSLPSLYLFLSLMSCFISLN